MKANPMIEATTRPDLLSAARAAHRARSLLAWRMIEAVRSLPRRMFARHWTRQAKRAAPSDRPCNTAVCAA